jgi:hypothetical protein
MGHRHYAAGLVADGVKPVRCPLEEGGDGLPTVGCTGGVGHPLAQFAGVNAAESPALPAAAVQVRQALIGIGLATEALCGLAGPRFRADKHAVHSSEVTDRIDLPQTQVTQGFVDGESSG